MMDRSAATMTMEHMRERSEIAFPVVVNLQIMRIDELMTSNTPFDATKVTAVYSALRALHSLIIAKKKDEVYEEEMKKLFLRVEADIDYSKIASITDTNRAKNQQSAAFKLFEVREKILIQMGNANLIPDEDIDAWPSFIPKTVVDEVYEPGPQDFDYKKEKNENNIPNPTRQLPIPVDGKGTPSP